MNWMGNTVCDTFVFFAVTFTAHFVSMALLIHFINSYHHHYKDIEKQ